MPNEILTPLAATGLAALAMLAGGALSHRFAHFLARHTAPVISFASGAMLMITFGHVLPEATELAGETTWLAVLAGVLLFYLLEHFSYLHGCPDHLSGHECKMHVLGPITAVGLGVHSFFDGILIVLAFLTDPTLGYLTTIGIILHKLPNGAILHSLVCLGRQKRSLFYVVAVALATPLATLVLPWTNKFTESEIGLGLAFSAGALLYITLSDLLPETHASRSRWNLVWLIFGLGMIFLVSHFLPVE
jgi:ZIP family zinc transporter